MLSDSRCASLFPSSVPALLSAWNLGSRFLCSFGILFICAATRLSSCICRLILILAVSLDSLLYLLAVGGIFASDFFRSLLKLRRFCLCTSRLCSGFLSSIRSAYWRFRLFCYQPLRSLTCSSLLCFYAWYKTPVKRWSSFASIKILFHLTIIKFQIYYY